MAAPSRRSHSEVDNIFSRERIVVKVLVEPRHLHEGMPSVILQKVKDKYENKCTKYGFIMANSVEIHKIGACVLHGLDGNVICEVAANVTICDPLVESVLKCQVECKNYSGILACLRVDGRVILEIMFLEIVNDVQKGDEILVEVTAKSWNDKDDRIRAWGKFVEKEDKESSRNDVPSPSTAGVDSVKDELSSVASKDSTEESQAGSSSPEEGEVESESHETREESECASEEGEVESESQETREENECASEEGEVESESRETREESECAPEEGEVESVSHETREELKQKERRKRIEKQVQAIVAGGLNVNYQGSESTYYKGREVPIKTKWVDVPYYRDDMYPTPLEVKDVEGHWYEVAVQLRVYARLMRGVLPEYQIGMPELVPFVKIRGKVGEVGEVKDQITDLQKDNYGHIFESMDELYVKVADKFDKLGEIAAVYAVEIDGLDNVVRAWKARAIPRNLGEADWESVELDGLGDLKHIPPAPPAHPLV